MAVNSLSAYQSPFTGLIKLQSSYTSGQQRVHNLQVSATDGAGMKSLVNAVVTISIISSNQGLPTFSSLLFKFSIPEDATPGASVGTVTATQQGNTYSIVSGDPQQMFQIGQTTGIITVAKTLDHDTIPSRLLGIQAQQGNPPRFGRAQANVTISDINDNKPEFSVNSIEIPVKENTPPATKIYQVRATDRDSGQNGMIRYSLTQNPQNMFAIDSITGAVSVQSQMDYEATKRYSVTIRAVDLNPTAPQSASMTLVVAVQDFNDNAPVFAKSSYKATIRESAGLREKFLQVSATDRDYGNNARITYTLRVSADAEWFGVYPNDGSVYVRKLLNQAPKETFALTVQAVDNGQPELSATASITVHVQDDNDHVPTFQADEYTFSVHENRPDMTQVGSVSAVDLDKGQNALIGYKIETKTDLFTINANTGLISTSVRLDREVDSTYVLHVSAADHGSPPKSTTVDVRINVIDENDNVPVFQRPGKYVAKVQENRPKGTLVAQVKANDVDLGVNGEVSYAISSGPSNLFAIHSITGQITTKEVLDFETGGSYQLIVSARDGGTPSRVATIPVEISVLDINENGPLFPSTVVNLNVVEGIPAGTVIGSVRIHGSAAQVKYYIVGGNLLGSFGINSLTGDIYTIREVDYETSSSYSLRVQAVDSNVLNRRSSFLTVNITILDLNDNAPKFEAEKIVLTVPENVGVGYSVNRYQASDKDKSVNGTVRYSIESETPSGGYFKIDAITGVLSTARAIDYENLKEVVLVIAASDNGPVAVRRKTRTTVRVLVDDKNDNAPIFVPHPRVDVMEDEPVDFPVVHVLADDADSGNNGKVTYRIESGNEDSHFKLDYETGLLSIIKLLDYEFKQLYRLRISATDHGSPARSSEQLIEVHVVDVNDHPPHFKQPLYSANVSENVIEGSYVAKIEAVDRDTGSNAELFYFIPNGIADNKFVVGKSTGIVTTAGNIDRETKDSYIITAYVKDGAYPARYDTTTVLVRVTDVNDNTPIFEKQTYYISIPENSAFTDIHTVGAMDKDLGANADITYLIIAGNSEGKFSLDSTTGRLSCSALDREVTPSYSLTIHAKDRGQPSRESTCRINVTVLDKNDNDPTFSRLKYTKVLMEDAPIGTSVTTITTSDNDIGINGAISYTLGNNTNGMFTIDSQTGVVTTVSAFDREKKSFYSFDVTAMDGGQYKSRKKTASVEVTILDVNDNVPIFKTIPYKKTIPQSTPAGGLVLRVEADDLDTGNNGNVVYSLEAENPYFKVDSTTGEIKTKRLLDNAALKVHQMIVIAKDLGSPQLSSKGVVEIQVGNQNVGPSVQFDSPSYTAQIKENSRVGSLVKMVQASYVGGNTANPITYSLASGNEANTFAIDSTQGMITVSNAAQLDYEAHSQIKLTVMAEGSGVSAYAMLTVNLVDKNDNPPKFTQDNYVSSVWEGATRNTFVTQVTAMDPDKGSNGEIVYTIIEGDEDRAFRIDPPYSGIVTTNLILDREIRNSYRLLIEAVDQGYPPRTSTCTLRIMVIDTNDNRPFFPRPPPVDISERTPVGTVITTVTANDVDLSPPLAYDFTSGGNPDNTFTIDKLSGKVTLAKPLDYEKRHQYTLRIQATDTVHPVTTDLVVNVIDENDNAPTFARNSYTISLPENTPSGVAVLNMNASDADSGLNSKLTYSMGVIPVDGFSIDKNTGTIYTNKTVVYNPQQPNYQFVVIVKDRGAPSLTAVAAVNIKIFDRNDEKPIFTKTTYEIHVKENAKKGTNVIQVTAVDADKSRVNSKVDYAITSGNQDEMFQMVSNTGEIVIVGSLDRERVNLYVMEVQGKDRGTPSQTGTSTVKIIIDDVNDWAPKFNKTEYKAKINESVTVGTAIVKVSAHDYDVGENSEIAYAILSGDVAGNFAIDTQTGRVTLAKSVDHEINKQHRLVVQATDCVTCPIERRLSSYCTVVIDVADVNDHKPFFPVLMYIEKVDENKPAGTHVFTAHANDQDAGVYGQLTYELESAQPGLFDINPSTGAVATKKVFDYEDPSGNQFYFKVKAVDNGGNTVPINVEVNIGSVDEYKPSFLKQGYQFSVRGDSKVGDVVGTVRATDADGGEDGRIVYSFRDPQEYFAINGTTGSVYVAKPLSENAKSKRKKRMAPRYERANAQHRHRRAIPQDTVSLLIEASSGKDGSLNDVVMVKVDINRTCQGCGISGPREQTGMLSGTAFVLVIVFPILTIIVIVVVVLLCLCRQRATKRNEPSDTASIQYGNHNGAFDPMPIQGVRHMTPVIKARAERSELVPPSYNELHGYSSTPNMTTSELSDQSHSASSGRGSAEENDDDEEICHINSSPLNQTNSLARKSMPDSGIQQDEDNVSEHSVQNHQEYLARLGIDVSKIGAEPTTKPATTSVESIHQFSEEGGGEGDGLDLGNIIYGKLAECEPDEDLSNISSSQELGFDEVEPSNAGSLSSVINSEEEFSGSYNWDYLLDWGPQYQPLAHVFTEIARLKDESIQPKKLPTQIVPQRPYPTSFNPAKMKNLPPPIITNAPPLAKLSSSSSQQNSPSYSPSSVQSGSAAPPRTVVINPSHVLPRSPITNDVYQSSAYTPSFTPSLSPLATGSPLVSPLNGSQGSISHASSLGGSGQTTPRGRRVINAYPAPRMSTSGSEQELHI
ncbi:protein dachsous-like [Tubulanus polymorphus]|uniref:protein dachsous-like n=1 Tax=Tubulanus polymorphus TaxID=672921 RepID=UPI003DA3F7F2